MQVWVKDRYVGELNERLAKPENGRGYVFKRVTFELPQSVGRLPRQSVLDGDLDVRVGTRQFMVSDFDRAQMTPGALEAMLKEYRVPVDHHRHMRYDKHAEIYSWRAFNLTIDLYEQVFDLDAFEPA